MTEMTTIKVSKQLRDALRQLADERGATHGEVLNQLIAEHNTHRLRQKLAFETTMAAALADPDAVARGERMARRAIAYLEERENARKAAQ